MSHDRAVWCLPERGLAPPLLRPPRNRRGPPRRQSSRLRPQGPRPGATEADKEKFDIVRKNPTMIVSRWSLQGHCLEGKRPYPSCLQAGILAVLMGGFFYGMAWLTRPIVGPVTSPPFLEYLGTATIVLGLVLMPLRQRRTLDGRARTLNDWSCLGWLVPGKATGLGEVRAVVIDREAKVIRGRDLPDSMEEVDNVWILDRGGDLRQLDSFPNRPFEARRTAEAASRLLGVEYRDTTCNPPDIKTPSELDESLGQRYLRKAQPLPEPQEPPVLWFRCLESPEGLDIRIPRAHLVDFWGPILWGMGLFLAALVLLVQLLDEDWMRMFPALLVGALPFSLPWICTSWPASRLTESLRLTRRSLKVDSTLYGRHEIPLAELEDLFLRDFRKNRMYRNFQVERYFPVGCLCARSDRVQACFGGSLDETNLEYLRALLLNRIVEYTRSD